MSRDLRVAVVGATGAVGQEILGIFEKRGFPISEIIPFASPRSKGKKIGFGGREYECQVLGPGCFEKVDLAFFDVSDEISKEWVPQAAEAGTWVIDNSATYRLEDDILLLVPEVNGDLLKDRIRAGASSARERILAGPNCSTAQMVMALKPIQSNWGLKRVLVSTYQSTSGGGMSAIQELKDQTRALLDGKSSIQAEVFPHQIAFNCIPHVGSFGPDDYTSEEHKMVVESRKLLSQPDLKMSVTAVRVPTLRCHGEAINIECERSFEVASVREALGQFPGIQIYDSPEKAIYPLGEAAPGDTVEGGATRDATYVGRLRRDPSAENALNLWVVSDNLRKGAALNAVQIGEIILPVFD